MYKWFRPLQFKNFLDLSLHCLQRLYFNEKSHTPPLPANNSQFSIYNKYTTFPSPTFLPKLWVNMKFFMSCFRRWASCGFLSVVLLGFDRDTRLSCWFHCGKNQDAEQTGSYVASCEQMRSARLKNNKKKFFKNPPLSSYMAWWINWVKDYETEKQVWSGFMSVTFQHKDSWEEWVRTHF